MLTIGYNYWHELTSGSGKTVSTNIFANHCKLHKFATIPIVFFKSITLDMHHYKTYMYIKFLAKSGYSRSVKTVHTNIFAKKLQVA